jgi:hypothetical protein
MEDDGMSVPLAEALEQVDLEAGRTYRCRVKGRVVLVRVLDVMPPEMFPAAPTENDVMLDPWVELPMPVGGIRLRSRPGSLPPPDVPEIPTDEDSP